MTQTQALHKFFSSFGIQAFPVTSVPDDVIFPYLTYDSVSGYMGDRSAVTVNLWFYTESEEIPHGKAQEIGDAIGFGGIVLPCDGGAIWITRGDPWCQTIEDENKNIKRRYLNITAEFMTT